MGKLVGGARRVELNSIVTVSASPSHSDLIARLRSDLQAAPYSTPAITGLWGQAADAALARNQRVPALRALDELHTRLGGVTPVSALAGLFLLGTPTSAADIDRALPTLGHSGALALGLIAASPVGGDSPSFTAAVDLRPYDFIDSVGVGSWWIVSDLTELLRGGAVPEEHVLGVGGASRTLAGLMVQSRVTSALDLGTGCGIQAMHAARHADSVVATDISARAIDYARFNAELNRIDNIEFRIGSLFEPVEGERFDHIVSNPPFVITPRVAGVPNYDYRDGGLVGDALVEAVVTSAWEHLNPGGIAQFLGNWESVRDRDGSVVAGLDRVGSWLAAADSNDELRHDTWVVERENQSAELYAETWIRDGGTVPGTPEFDGLYNAWLSDFDARGVTGIGFGYLTLRRARGAARQGSHRHRAERLPGAIGAGSAAVGLHVEACLVAWDWLAGVTDSELLAATLTVAPDVTVERHYWPGDDDPTAMTLRQGGGFARSIPVETALAALVGACDGELSVGAISDALAQILEADSDALRAELLPAVRDLVSDGILLP